MSETPQGGGGAAAGLLRRVASRGSAHPAAAVLLLDTLLAVLLFERAWRAPSTTWVGGVWDPQQDMWFLRWTPWAIAHGQNPLLTDHLNAPAGANLMWNILMPLPGLVLWPVTTWLGPVVAYNVLVTAGVALSAWCAFLLLRRHVSGIAGPLAGGLLYGFSPYVLAQSEVHPHVAFAAIPPLMVMVIEEMIGGRRVLRSGALLGLLAAAQLLIGEELLVSEVVAGAVLLAVLAVLHRDSVRARVASLTRGLAAALAVFTVICTWPLAVQLGGPQRITTAIQPPGVYVTDLANIVSPTELQAVSPAPAVDLSHRYSGGNASEWDGYLGLPLLAICLWAAVRCWRSPVVRVASLCGACLLLLSLGPSLHVAGVDTHVPLPWRALQGVPLLDDVLPGRMAVFVDLAAALLLATFVAALRMLDRQRLRVAAALLVLCALTLAPTLPYLATSRPVPQFFTDAQALRRIPEGSMVLVLPLPGSLFSDPMLWQAEADMRFRMPGGYVNLPGPRGGAPVTSPSSVLSAYLQAARSGRGPAPPEELAAVHRELTRWNVRTVIIGPGAEGTLGDSPAMVRLLGDLPTEFDGVLVWYGVDPSLIPPPSGILVP